MPNVFKVGSEVKSLLDFTSTFFKKLPMPFLFVNITSSHMAAED
jgi:hypothetical protein